MSKDGSSDNADPEVPEDPKVPPEEPIEEEEEEEESEEDDDEEEDAYSTKLRSGRQRSNPSQALSSGRGDRKQSGRGKRPGTKRRRTPNFSRGRKKTKMGYANDWQDDKRQDSDSDDSYRHPEDPDSEAAPVIAQKFLYNPGIPWPDLSIYLQHIIEIRVAKEFLSFNNKEVSSRRLWGTDVYTSDSDIVAVIHHAGLMDISQVVPEQYEGVAVYARITKGRSNYVSTFKNGVKSKKCVNYEGHSIKPDKVVYLTNLGSLDELREMASRMPTDFQRQRVKQSMNMKKKNLVPQVFVTSSLSFEQWAPYSLEYLGDKGSDERTYLSTKLKTSVLYLETDSERYELCRVQEEDADNDIFNQGNDKFRWSLVKSPLLTKDMKFMAGTRIPLDSSWAKPLHKSNFYTGLEWQEIEWGSVYVNVKGIPYGPLKCVRFYSMHA